MGKQQDRRQLLITFIYPGVLTPAAAAAAAAEVHNHAGDPDSVEWRIRVTRILSSSRTIASGGATTAADNCRPDLLYPTLGITRFLADMLHLLFAKNKRALRAREFFHIIVEKGGPPKTWKTQHASIFAGLCGSTLAPEIQGKPGSKRV